MLKTAWKRRGLGSGRENPHRCGAIRTQWKLLGRGHNRRVQQGDPPRMAKLMLFESGPAAELSRQNYGHDAGAVLVLQRADSPVWDWHCVVGESVNFRGGIDGWAKRNRSHRPAFRGVRSNAREIHCGPS